MDNKNLIANTDREMLDYLMQAFDNEISVCERCGHSEPTKDMDSAGFLRDYLVAYPATEAKPSASAAPGIDEEALQIVVGGWISALDYHQDEEAGPVRNAWKALVGYVNAAIAAAHEAGRQEGRNEAQIFRRDHLIDRIKELEAQIAAAPHPQAKAQEPAGGCVCVSGDTYKPYGCEKCNPDLARTK